ncbi:MAG: hypothetical protein AAGH45_13155 [Pseudomonadota bacterium]
MAPANFTIFDPLFEGDGAATIVKLAAAFGPHGMYSEEGLNEGIGENLPQRFDAFLNYVDQNADVLADPEEAASIIARTNYFRETYAYGDDIKLPGIERFMHHPGLLEAAGKIFDRPVVEPAIVFANVYVPGQELAVHTDVPEFRGADRKKMPQWLLVVMHHSGLFERWRMPIATCVSWYHDADGGEFIFYPEGKDAAPVFHPARYNTAVILDTDSVFHGVGRLSEKPAKIPDLRPGMTLGAEADGAWVVRDGDRVIARYDWADMRLSISWKAYCFADEAERALWREHKEGLSLLTILDTLEADLRERGALSGERPTAEEFAKLLVRTYIEFPPRVDRAA